MNDEFDNLMVQFESEYSIEKIVDVVKKIPVELREKIHKSIPDYNSEEQMVLSKFMRCG